MRPLRVHPLLLVQAVVAVYLTGAGLAQAQSTPPPGRIEMGLGARWTGGESFSSRNATETTPGGSPTTLFSTSTELTGSATLDARVAVRLTPSFEAEISGSYGAPTLQTTITNDVEVAGSVTATDTVSQFTLGGGLLWYVPWRSPAAARWAPFVAGGAAYLRQIHEGGTLAETGRVYELGGGVKYLLSTHPRRFKAIGLRFEALAVARSQGISLDNGTRWSPAVGASLFARFE